MSIPGYDAWKLATPPEYDITPEQEREIEDEQRRDEFREAIEACIEDNRHGLTGMEVFEIVTAVMIDYPLKP